MGNKCERPVEQVKEIIYGGAPRDSRQKIITITGPRDSNSYYQYKSYKVNPIEQGIKKDYTYHSDNNGQVGQVIYQVSQYPGGVGPQDTFKVENNAGARYGGGSSTTYYEVRQNYGPDVQQNYYTANVERIPTHLNFETSSVDRIREGGRQVRTEVININDLGDYVEVPLQYKGVSRGRAVSTITIGGGGINAGLYRFGGDRLEVREEDEYPRGNIVIEEEEILKEINRRKRKSESVKKKTYELIDKYYAVTEVDAKSVRRRLKEEQSEEERRYQVHTTGDKAGGYGANYSEMQMRSGQRGGGYKYGYSDKQMFSAQSGGQRGGGYKYEYSESQMRGKGGKWGYGASNRVRGNLPSDNYSKYLFEQINRIRTNPQSFIGAIEDSKANITRDKHGRLIYKSKIKVALADGESTFNEAIDYLRNTKPMEPLVFSSEITVDPPLYESEINDRNDLRRKVEYMTESGINIKAYWRDIIKDPQISFLLMIVDDTGSKNGLRRKDILDPEMKYIGISSIERNGKFVCYMTLSPEL